MERGENAGSTFQSFFKVIKSSHSVARDLTLSPHIYSFHHTKEKSFRKTLWNNVKLLKMSNFTFFHNVF